MASSRSPFFSGAMDAGAHLIGLLARCVRCHRLPRIRSCSHDDNQICLGRTGRDLRKRALDAWIEDDGILRRSINCKSRPRTHGVPPSLHNSPSTEAVARLPHCILIHIAVTVSCLTWTGLTYNAAWKYCCAHRVRTFIWVYRAFVVVTTSAATQEYPDTTCPTE